MMEHKDDFLLFATNNTTGEQLSDGKTVLLILHRQWKLAN